jgi:hypothetical protein
MKKFNKIQNYRNVGPVLFAAAAVLGGKDRKEVQGTNLAPPHTMTYCLVQHSTRQLANVVGAHDVNN